MCVRPILTMSSHSTALTAIASRSAVTAGINRSLTLTAAVMCIAAGKESFEHRDMLAAERCACELAATVRNDLVDVHVELGAAPGHPHMQREHILMVAAEDLVTSSRDQHVDFTRQSTTLQIGLGSCTL